LLVKGEKISLKSGITVLRTLDETLEHTALSALISWFVIVAVAVLELEDLGIDNILKSFVRLILETGLDEVELLELELALSSDGTLVKLFSHHIVFGVLLKVCLEVIAVHLFLFCESTEEIGVVFSPSLAFFLKHALLSALVVLGVRKLSSGEFLDLVESSIKFADGLLDVVPGFIKILTIWSWEINSMLSQLTVDLSE
jgi:hypothetical protein